MSKDPINVIKSLISKKYPEAKCVFWAGSVSKGKGNAGSDLDLVIIFDKLPNAYRAAYIYEGWPVDSFIHDPETLEYFFQQTQKTTYILGLATMVAEGVIVLGGKEAEELQAKARKITSAKPAVSKEALDRKRFLITDSLDDLKDPENEHEKTSIVFHLYSQLAEFYLLSNGHWIGSSKQLARILHNSNALVADKFAKAFTAPFIYNKIHDLALDIMQPHGGLLWDGFKSDAPSSCRIKLVSRRPCNKSKNSGYV